jgi:4-hydroxy-2-oxoheptanedioate aldolase
MRGVAGVTRATRFGRIAGYGKVAASELCLLVQIETQEALAQLKDIAAVDGVDGIFIGPADLAASLGIVGELSNPKLIATIEDAIRRIRACGKPAGILTPDNAFASRCIELGTTFTAVGVDAAILARGTEALAQKFRKQ